MAAGGNHVAEPREFPTSAISQDCPSLPSPAGSHHPWAEKPPLKEVPQLYLAVLELKLDLGVINHFAQIPDNRLPPALLEQGGEPLVQVFLLVFRLGNDLYGGYRRQNQIRAGGRAIPRTSSQQAFLGQAPWAGAQDGLFVVGSPCQRGAGAGGACEEILIP